jgi:hypothetical protein
VGSMARLAHHCSAGSSPVRVGFASDRAVITRAARPDAVDLWATSVVRIELVLSVALRRAESLRSVGADPYIESVSCISA